MGTRCCRWGWARLGLPLVAVGLGATATLSAAPPSPKCASALACVLFPITLALTPVQPYLGKRWVYYEGQR